MEYLWGKGIIILKAWKSEKQIEKVRSLRKDDQTISFKLTMNNSEQSLADENLNLPCNKCNNVE